MSGSRPKELSAHPSQLSFMPKRVVGGGGATWVLGLDLAVQEYWRNRPDPRAVALVEGVSPDGWLVEA